MFSSLLQKMEVSGQLHLSSGFTPVESSCYIMGVWSGSLWNQSGFGRDENILCLHQGSNPMGVRVNNLYGNTASRHS